MFCPNCGERISEKAEICPNCGVRVPGSLGEDKPNIPANIISFCCIPILGIILFFVWKDSKPRAAKTALISSLASIGLIILFYIVALVFGLLVDTEGY